MFCSKKKFKRLVDKEVCRRIDEIERENRFYKRIDHVESYLDTRFYNTEQSLEKIRDELRLMKKEIKVLKEAADPFTIKWAYLNSDKPTFVDPRNEQITCSDCKIDLPNE